MRIEKVRGLYQKSAKCKNGLHVIDFKMDCLQWFTMKYSVLFYKLAMNILKDGQEIVQKNIHIDM